MLLAMTGGRMLLAMTGGRMLLAMTVELLNDPL